MSRVRFARHIAGWLREVAIEETVELVIGLGWIGCIAVSKVTGWEP